MENLKGMFADSSNLRYGSSTVHFAEVSCSSIDSPVKEKTDKEQLESHSIIANGGDKIIPEWNSHNKVGKYCLGGLTWSIAKDHKMEDFLLFWIGQDNSAFANIVLTFNTCEIGSASSYSLVLFAHLFKYRNNFGGCSIMLICVFRHFISEEL